MDCQVTGPDDKDAQISIRCGEEIQFWCERLDCTAAALGNAIGQVGYSVERVCSLLAAETRALEPRAAPEARASRIEPAESPASRAP
jgi:hypothetical protein